MFDEIQALRSLSVELNKGGLTTEDATAGVKIIKRFNQLGVDPAQHELLVGACDKAKTPGLIEAALKLCAVEAESGIPYNEALSQYLHAIQELPLAKSKLAELKTELANTSTMVKDNKKQLKSIEYKTSKIGEAVMQKIAEANAEIEIKMKQSQVTKQEIEQVAGLKAALAEHALDISTLIKMAKEFTHEED